MNEIRSIDGPCLAGFELLDIYVIGKGGHSSLPENVIDPIKPATHLYIKIDDL